MSLTGIHLGDVDELNYSVDPWELRMSQLSPGNLQVDMYITQLDDIFISSEFWSKKIVAGGMSPAGHIVLAGTVDGGGFSWCGNTTSATSFAFANGTNEIGFVTRDNEHHWTLLIPIATALDELGEELLVGLPSDQRFVHCKPHLTQALSSAVMGAIDIVSANRGRDDLERVVAYCRSRVLSASARLLLSIEGRKNPRDGNVRLSAYNNARQYLERHYHSDLSVNDLAVATGVSRRTLELGFKQEVGISPAIFLRRYRLNRLYHELKNEFPGGCSVTEAAHRHGFSHLGRMAGYYSGLFGESPSETLKTKARYSGVRFSDVLRGNTESLS